MLIFRPPTAFVSQHVAIAKKTAMERLIDGLAPKMQRAIRQAAKTAQGRIQVEELARLIEQGRVSRAVLEVDVDRFVEDDLAAAEKVLGEAIAAGAKLGSAHLKGTLRFDITNPAAVRAAETQAAALVTAVNEETKTVIRGLITRSYREGITAQETARLVRNVVGLNERQATALINYRFGLLEDGVEAERVSALAEKYSARLLRQRAEMIARTEIHRASAEGQHELWRQAVRAGRLNPGRAKRIWIPNAGACFTADSLVMTRGGPTPIADIIVGAMVLGPSGHWCRVSAVRAIPYSGRLVRGEGFSCTPDHRLLSSDGVWWPAIEYLGEAAWQVSDDARAEEAQHGPSALAKVVRLPFVFPGDLGLGVPVVSVGEDDDIPCLDREVGGPPAVHRNLFLERYAGFRHRLRQRYLNAGRFVKGRKVRSVAALGAEIWSAMSDATRVLLESLAAAMTDGQHFRLPRRIAAPAHLWQPCGLSALGGTVNLSPMQAFLPSGNEQATAERARTLTERRPRWVGLERRRQTSAAAVPLAASDVASRDVLLGSADFAPVFDSASVRRLHPHDHILPALRLSDDDYDGPVYDITVEEEHAFVLACGLVAHNCEWCEGVADLNEDGVPVDGQFQTPDGDLIDGPEDSHPNCRCGTGLEFGEE